jgi:hypothetical protein
MGLFNSFPGSINKVELNVVQPNTVLVGDRVILGGIQGNTSKNSVPPFEFFLTEVPETLPLGGYQIAAVHQFPGDGAMRSVDTYGDQPRAIEFSGHLMSINDGMIPATSGSVGGYAQAIQRMEQLDKYRKLGKATTFRFGNYEWFVVVSQFLPNVHNDNDIEYTIRMEIVQDNTEAYAAAEKDGRLWDDIYKPPAASALLQFLRASALAMQVAASIKNVLPTLEGLIKTATTNPAGLIWNGVAIAVGADAAPVVNEIQVSIQSLTDFAATDQPTWIIEHQTAQPYETLNNKAVQYLRDETKRILGYLSPAQDTLHKVDDPDVKAFSATQLNSLVASLTQLMRSLDAMLSPSLVPNVTVANPDLRLLAAKYYGDPNKWTLIGDANGINTPTPTGVVTLKIPAGDNA